METLESLVGPAWERGSATVFIPQVTSQMPMPGGMPPPGGHGTVELSSVLASVCPSTHFAVERLSPYLQSHRQAMTTSGVALHRSIRRWLQGAGQSFCSMYDGP